MNDGRGVRGSVAGSCTFLCWLMGLTAVAWVLMDWQAVKGNVAPSLFLHKHTHILSTIPSFPLPSLEWEICPHRRLPPPTSSCPWAAAQETLRMRGKGFRVAGHLMTRSGGRTSHDSTHPHPTPKAAWLAGAELELVVPGWTQKDLEQQGLATKINIKGVEGMQSGPFCCLEMEGSPGECRR